MLAQLVHNCVSCVFPFAEHAGIYLQRKPAASDVALIDVVVPVPLRRTADTHSNTLKMRVFVALIGAPDMNIHTQGRYSSVSAHQLSNADCCVLLAEYAHSLRATSLSDHRRSYC